MARFFLHISNGGGYAEDTEGLELPDLGEARRRAIDGIRSLLSEEARHGQLDLSGAIEIADGDGNILLIVPFSEAVDLRLRG
jgi:hypothetical protein